MLLRTFLGLKVRHVNSAFKMVRKSLLNQIVILSDGWLIDAELIYKVQKLGAETVEIPIAFPDRTHGVSSISMFTWIKVLRDLAYLMRNKDKS